MKKIIIAGCTRTNYIAFNLIKKYPEFLYVFVNKQDTPKPQRKYESIKRNLCSISINMLLRPDILFRLWCKGRKERKEMKHFVKPNLCCPPNYLIVNNYNSKEYENILKVEDPDLLIVLGGIILKPQIFNKGKLGCLNIHSSLLPFGRGRDGPFWALYYNKPAGFTVHYITEQVDAGDIVFQKEVETKEGDTPLSLRKRIADEIINSFPEILDKFKDGKSVGRKQEFGSLSNKHPTFKDRFELEITPSQSKSA
ncbi:hypothetical protein LCGC14_0694100 [marine sediment metagenome]|uniref:phosphoribosylglycinamide formyltransferase 1 n=1 Tax=marine sediment metagenome TaxID=412755 RepID=A0A0F9TSG7_9ZZZZ